MTASHAGRLGVLCLTLALLCWLPAGWAHPVAQGALTVTIMPDAIELHVRVSAEEVIVANAFAPAANRARDVESMVTAHALYLADHIHVHANGQRMLPLLARPPANAGSIGEHIDYELHYPGFASLDQVMRSNERAGNGELRIGQNVLNEFEFAPGNPWEATFIVNIVDRGRVMVVNRLLTSGTPLTYNVVDPAPHSSGTAVAVQSDLSRSFADYLRHGVMHILGGYDHLLFIGALVLAVITLWDLVKIVTVFTLAHSLTLTLSILDVLRLPTHIVEPVIAASIVVVALSNLLWPTRSRSNWRLIVVFGFGLFHGLGFAGGLLTAMEGLAGAGVAVAILGFSLGVELGHQFVVLPLFCAIRMLDRNLASHPERTSMRRGALMYGSVAILIGGVVYLLAALSAAGTGLLAMSG